MSQSKRKILYLVTQSEWGGAQEYVYNLATNLDKNQDQALVLAGEGSGELLTALESQKLPYQALKWTRRAINPLFDLPALFELMWVFNRERPDIIHLNSSKIGFLGSLAAKLSIHGRVAKVIYTAHGWVFNEPLPWLIKKLYYWIEKISASWKNAIICVAEADRQTALTNNFKSKIVTINNAVEAGKLNFLNSVEAREKLLSLTNGSAAAVTEKTKIVCTIANLYPAKGLNYLIPAAALVLKQNPDLIFLVMGEGAERTALQAEIDRLSLNNNFFLLGHISQAHQYLKAADLFVLPSVKEGLPYAVLKARAAGLPIVATKTGALPEILRAELLAQPGNIEDLADKIMDALDNPFKYLTQPATDFKDFFDKTLACYN